MRKSIRGAERSREIGPLTISGTRLRCAARRTAAAAAVGTLVVSTQGLAAGFLIRETSTIGVATVYAGNGSRADAASTVFNNPAGMTRLTQNELEGGVSVILPSVPFRGDATLGNTSVGGANGDAGRAAFVPNLHWVFGITDRLKGGISVTAPFGNSVVYDGGWPGRYLGIKTAALSVDINPGIAYRLSDTLSIGGGVSAQYFDLEATSAIPQFAILAPGAPDAYLRFKGNDWAFGYNFGVLFELPSTTRFGLTYRSHLNHRLEGDLDFTGASPFLGLVSGAAAADAHLPSTIGFSVTKDFTAALILSADIQFNDWSVFKRVIIESQNAPIVDEQRYRDSWMVSVGGIYRLNDDWTLRAGLAYDQTPITDHYRTVTLPDNNRYLIGLGFGYRLTDTLYLDAGYQHSFAAHADMNKSLNNTDLFTHAIVLNGQYNVTVDLVAFSLRYKY